MRRSGTPGVLAGRQIAAVRSRTSTNCLVQNIAVYANENNLEEEVVITENIVYPE